MKKTIATICLVAVCAISISFYVQKKIAPIVDSITHSKAQYVGNKIINETITQFLSDEKVSELYILSKDNNGNITSETTNVTEMNLLKSRIHNLLNEQFSRISQYDFKIPIGSLAGMDWINNLGPGIPVTLNYTGAISMDIKTDFTSAGINQTKHTSVLQTKTEVYAFVSGRKINCIIENEIPIAEVIVLGEVPNSYLNADFPR